jgi:hypothetical protein
VYASSSTLGSMRYDGNAVVGEPRESLGVDKVDNSFFLLFLSPRCCYVIQCVVAGRWVGRAGGGQRILPDIIRRTIVSVIDNVGMIFQHSNALVTRASARLCPGAFKFCFVSIELQIKD